MSDNSQIESQAYEQLAERNRELRKANLKLLQEKRELLLQVQHGHRAQSEATRLSETCEELTKKNELLQLRQNNHPLIEGSKRCNEKISSVDEATATKEGGEIECNCELSKRLNETVKVNHQWNDAYQRSIDRYHQLEKKNRSLEGEVQALNEENKILGELVEKFNSDLKLKNSNSYQRSLSRERFCSNDDIEALKLQLLAYQEDFNCEKEENEKTKQQKRKMQTKLQEADALIETLKNQVDEYKHYVARMTEEKHVVLGELRRLSNSSYFLPNPTFHEPLQRNSSYPLESLQLMQRSLSSSRFHRSDSDIYKNADVVRDHLLDSHSQ